MWRCVLDNYTFGVVTKSRLAHQKGLDQTNHRVSTFVPAQQGYYPLVSLKAFIKLWLNAISGSWCAPSPYVPFPSVQAAFCPVWETSQRSAPAVHQSAWAISGHTVGEDSNPKGRQLQLTHYHVKCASASNPDPAMNVTNIENNTKWKSTCISKVIQASARYLEILCGRVQGVLDQVGVVTASLQQHENVLQLQVDLGIQRALDIQHWRGAGGDQRKGSDISLQAVLFHAIREISVVEDRPSKHNKLC